ncbi:MAG: serine protease [Bacteroidetes bacterium]|jgi:hypothetical protein|nr:serine protease [Bacteroidota bacterium]
MEYFNQLEPLLRMFWFVAIPASIIFVIQTVMTFLGTDAHDGAAPDFDGDLGDAHDTPFQLFSFRNLINFLIGFSWGGISLYKIIPNTVLLVLVSLLVGFLFVALFFFIIRQMMRLAEDNSFRLKDAVGKSGDVYIRIPARKTGKGKVQVSVNGAVHELDAVTQGDELPSGSLIRVVSLVDEELLLVEKL